MPKKSTTKKTKLKTPKLSKSSQAKKRTNEVKSETNQANAVVHPVLSQTGADEILTRFFQVISDLRSIKESKIFLLDFLTESERMTFAKRLAIGLELNSGKSYDEVRKMYGVSSATISTVASMMKSQGMKLALQKISTEKWADNMTSKFLKLFRVRA